MGLLIRLVLTLLPVAVMAATAGQPRVTVTQIDPNGDEIGQSHEARCSAEECRVALPVAFPEATCTVAVRIRVDNTVTLSRTQRILHFEFTTRDCVSGSTIRPLIVLSRHFPDWVRLGGHDAASQTVHLGIEVNDLVDRPSTATTSVRIDSVFPLRSQN
jgi:hypothetical protein